ncbi:formimidoylglutamase [Simiduia curdlanivorans]|uniref:Formimidoylglutamase n=1 Tax=Simiduia curdlanivorans TaxID=1492769 RepID=A0ABV8V451_9GAMM|nr:formimidoylglutamase [Simiduia curdlanivorans]MDN3640084.1 formimidoylglutamase [Simiduia curdlanivorans]
MNLYQPNDGSQWTGRIDAEETRPALRWHQKIQCINLDQSETLAKPEAYRDHLALLGFQCDAGVVRNKGRPGAAEGPQSLRVGLANAACADQQIFDAGDVTCLGDNLEVAQTELGKRVDQLITLNLRPVVLGGGHEIAWASFQGLIPTLREKKLDLGIINFDAHLDLRTPSPKGSSGTPFRQINEWCKANNQAFNYCVLGVNPSANTQALFDYADEHSVACMDDIAFETNEPLQTQAFLDQFLNRVDALYITVCLDVFNAAFAPGVSAPAALGISPTKMLHTFQQLLKHAQLKEKPVLLLDIAELSPPHDRDGITAKLGARIIWQYQQFYPTTVAPK